MSSATDPHDRAKAAEQLGEILPGPKEAMPALRKALSDDPPTRFAVASALAKIILDTSMEENFDLLLSTLDIVYSSSGIETRS